ncbi:MAG: vWA domain-containing protein [Gammaproteobacteria bacterium]|nr:VWA domain-containing protein [Gammaproteobacteria bacterium]
MVDVELLRPWMLLFLPLALLPLLRSRQEALGYSYVAWIPRDSLGRAVEIAAVACAVVAIAATVVGLAGPGRPESRVMRTGRGAEILVLMDRSRSMDERMMPSDWQATDPLARAQQAWHRGPQKSHTARELLSRFVAARAEDRFALMYFSGGPLLAVPFTHRTHVLQAGITAAGIGGGLNETNVGRALNAAIAEFDQRPYSGSRIILLVSDGGAHLDETTRERIVAGLERNGIALYWLYLRSISSPALDEEDPRREMAPEIALHRFFKTLRTPYRAYQAEVPEDLTRAVNEVARQHNLPLDYFEEIPRRDYSRIALAIAALACVVLLLYRGLQLRRWS